MSYDFGKEEVVLVNESRNCSWSDIAYRMTDYFFESDVVNSAPGF